MTDTADFPPVVLDAPVAATRAGLLPLVVDLDHTLIKTDLLLESLWRKLAQGPQAILAFMGQLRLGRAGLKAYLADSVTIDVTKLPYNPAVLELVAAARAQGRATVLCTASDQRLAAAIAAHLDCFDEAHGSDGERNLKGHRKAAFLADRFGERGFDYVGDSQADLVVWKRANNAYTVGLGSLLKRRIASGSGGQAIELPSTSQGLKPYVKVMRPHQWLKNVLVFLPILAAHEFAPAKWLATLVAFLAFSMVASSVYLTNDLLDLDADRNHPRKRNRPFASGAADIAIGSVMAILLLAVGFALALLVEELRFAGVLALYYVLTTAYSLSLKRKLVIDICTLAGLYTLRVVAGSTATGTPMSEWLIGFCLFFFLSLAAVKRQAELVDGLKTGKEKASGRAYQAQDLPIVSSMAIAAGYAAVLQFGLYLNSDKVLRLYQSPKFLWGISPILLFWTSRMVMRAHRGGMHDDPIIFAVRDRISQYCAVVILGLVLAAALT